MSPEQFVHRSIREGGDWRVLASHVAGFIREAIHRIHRRRGEALHGVEDQADVHSFGSVPESKMQKEEIFAGLFIGEVRLLKIRRSPLPVGNVNTR